MIFYAAAVSVAPGPLEELICAKRGRRLFTFFHHRSGQMGAKDIAWWSAAVAAKKTERVHLLDSGAYSAWKAESAIDLDEYVQYIQTAPPLFKYVVNVDVIPGSWGEIPSQAEIDKSAERGWENYWYLCKKLAPLKITPLHTYHQGESTRWLTKLMDEAGYFCVSPANDRTASQKAAWLDEIMPMLTDAKGRPIRKWHGLGVTTLSLIRRYPWYSVDSTTWRQMARFGIVVYPDMAKQFLTRIDISDLSPRRAEAGSWHYDRLAPAEQDRVRAFIEAQGCSVDVLRTSLLERDKYNLSAFYTFFENWVDRPHDRRDVATDR